MPPARTVRQRTVTNENDENGTTRVTRAKAAAIGGPLDGPIKKAAQSKKTTASTTDNGQPRKRAALGDVSNVNKGDAVEAKEGKKSTTGLVSKAAQPTGIQKSSKTNTSRSILGPRDKNTGGNELKRPASTTGVAGQAPKAKRANTSGSSRRSTKDSEEEENKEPAVNQAAVQLTETLKVKAKSSNGNEVEKEFKREEHRLKQQEEDDEEESFGTIAEVIRSMDAEDQTDPLMVSEYVYEILDYMKELEITTAPNPNYMEHQKDLDWRMRGVLIDWLLEVHTRFHLLPETFYLTVNIIDRFLSHKVVQVDRLQLVGVTAMFIASKYEEVLSPHIGNFRHVADDTFSENEILSAERFILATLNYDLSFPNPMHFMRRISKADNYDIQTRTMAKYLLEISLLDNRFLGIKPSVSAAASMHLARVILEKGHWDEILVHYSGYTEQEIAPALETMLDYLRSPVAHNAFYKKYAGKKFLKASLHARAWAKKYGGDLAGAKGDSASNSP